MMSVPAVVGHDVRCKHGFCVDGGGLINYNLANCIADLRV